jgi:uncharacterized membrane protein
MTEAKKESQRERFEQAAHKLEAEMDMTSRQIADMTGRKASGALWSFLLGVAFGVAIGAFTGVTLTLLLGGAVVVP